MIFTALIVLIAIMMTPLILASLYGFLFADEKDLQYWSAESMLKRKKDSEKAPTLLLTAAYRPKVDTEEYFSRYNKN